MNKKKFNGGAFYFDLCDILPATADAITTTGATFTLSNEQYAEFQKRVNEIMQPKNLTKPIFLHVPAGTIEKTGDPTTTVIFGCPEPISYGIYEATDYYFMAGGLIYTTAAGSGRRAVKCIVITKATKKLEFVIF